MNVILVIVELFTLIMQRSICKRVFDRKNSSMGIEVAAWMVFYVISNVATYFFELPFWGNMFIFLCSFFLLLVVLYEGSIKVKIVVTIFLYLIGMLSEVITGLIGVLGGIGINMMQNKEVILISAMLSKLVWFLEVKLALLFLKKNRNIVIGKMDWMEVFIIPVSSIFIVLAIFMPFREDQIVLKLIAAALIFVVNLFSFYNYNELQEKALYQVEKAFLTQQVNRYAEHLSEMSWLWQQTREYRHDMKQRYLLLESYLNQGKYEKIRELYQREIETINREKTISKTGNISFDMIVNYKAAVAEKSGIEVRLDAVIPYDIKLQDVDLYSLLGNLFDNAIEAVKTIKIGVKEIVLRARTSGNNLYLEMENPYTGELKKQGNSYLTTKEDGKEHGMGLRIVENIVNRHKGQMIIKDEDHCFKIQVLLYEMGE